MLKTRFAQDFVSIFLIVSMTFYPLHSYADAIADAAADASVFSQDSIDGFNNATTSISGQDVSLPTLSNGTFTSGGDTINTNDLFPAGAEHYPNGDPDLATLKGIAGDDNDMINEGQSYQARLHDDVTATGGSTTTSSAYSVMVSQANTIYPDMTNDPVFNSTRNIYANIDAISAEFNECTTNTSFSTINNAEHIPDYKTCERVVDKSTNCNVVHSIEVEDERVSFAFEQLLTGGTASITKTWGAQMGGFRTLKFEVQPGRPFTAWARFRFFIADPANFTAFEVDGNVPFDEAGVIWHRSDLASALLGEAGNITIAEYLPHGATWDEANLVYIPNSTNRWTTVQPTTQNLLPLLKPGWNEIGIAVENSTGPGGTRITFQISKGAKVSAEDWTPQSCISAAKGYFDGFASGSVTCSAIQASAKTTGCISVNGKQICSSDLAPSPFPNVSNLCETVNVDVDYNFNKGTSCFLDANNKQVCIQGGTGQNNTCAALENDPSCSFVSLSCVEGAEAADGSCYVQEDIWDCGYDVNVPATTSSTSVTCAGPIRCMGEDCVTPNRTVSESFEETAALLNAVQFMTQDMTCDPSGDCRVFSATPLECKKAVGGAQDCCDIPTNVSLGSYITAMYAMGKLDTSLMALNNTSAIKGAYVTLRQPVVNSVSTVTKPFVSYAEGIAADVTAYAEPMVDYVVNLAVELQQAVAKTLADLTGQVATDMGADTAKAAAAERLADEAKETATQKIIQGGSVALGWLMVAYTAYTVAVMVVQAVYECEEPEYELAAKRDVKACHYVGSYCNSDTGLGCIEKRETYCCFSSPLGRIVNEQLKPQLGESWGSATRPECEGLMVSDLAKVDWSLVDLGEWTAMLQDNDLLADPLTMDMDSITGSGNDFNKVTEDERPSAEQRALDRIDGLDVDALRREAHDNTAVTTDGS